MDRRSPAKAVPAQKQTFTDYLRANTHWFIDPIVAFMARVRISPDWLTAASLVSHFLFAWLVIQGQMRWAGLAIFLLSPLDALDGSLARKLGRQQGGFGAYLDSTLDRVSEIVLFGAFIWYYAGLGQRSMVMLALAALAGSILVSYSRARAESLGYTGKVGLFSRVERYFVLVATLLLNVPAIGLLLLAAGTTFTVAQRAYHVWRQAH